MNIITALVDILDQVVSFLSVNKFLNVSLLYWSLAFILTNMVVSLFWKGAHG